MHDREQRRQALACDLIFFSEDIAGRVGQVAVNLVYGGYSDWRQPGALNQNLSGSCGLYNCSGSEMGRIFYTEGGGLGSHAGIALVQGVRNSIQLKSASVPRHEHLPIYKAALDVAVGFEKLVAGFSRCHKYTLGTELRNGSRRFIFVSCRQLPDQAASSPITSRFPSAATACAMRGNLEA